MTGLLQNLARIGRGEPIPGAARVALPPRFAAPPRNDDAPVHETTQDERQTPASSPAALPNMTGADDPATGVQAPQRRQREPDNEGAPLRLEAKVAAAAQPLQSTDALLRSPVDAPLPAAPRDPLRGRQPRDTVLRETPRPRNEAVTPPALPLGQTVLAGQAQRRRETPPVIKVTIDRIDIRSPEPPRAARAVKPAPKPSVSLSDYLRRPGPGGRA
ncbi:MULTISPECIES: hypothetical protein [Bradyrhizobium]|uniref:hypothetical protein n=1 Tax=Bradyrhizobium TaxID=374 RepID=UPI0024AEB96B|nr:hypothetical protein [Bradyrhizobium barranii]WFT93139.1 hypothetical protein QA633_33195 [Bradyrhizobium barranii]